MILLLLLFDGGGRSGGSPQRIFIKSRRVAHNIIYGTVYRARTGRTDGRNDNNNNKNRHAAGRLLLARIYGRYKPAQDQGPRLRNGGFRTRTVPGGAHYSTLRPENRPSEKTARLYVRAYYFPLPSRHDCRPPARRSVTKPALGTEEIEKHRKRAPPRAFGPSVFPGEEYFFFFFFPRSPCTRETTTPPPPVSGDAEEQHQKKI